MSQEEESNLKELCLFFSLVYVRAWLSAPIATDAPVNDLELLKTLHKYKTINAIISSKTLEKMDNHLWYLGPELVPLSLFSNMVNI
jgi:hypothetical protein